MNLTKARRKVTPGQLLEAVEGVGIIILCYLTLFLKSYRDRWGLTKEMSGRELPGDHIVPIPRTVFTHGIEIDAPADFVWPWIAQLGKDRGGFYSYELLENIIGLEIYNANSLLPDHQDPAVGDLIPFGPDMAYPLVICEPGKAMVIENCDDLDRKKTYNPDEGHPRNFLHLSWLWFVEPIDANRSRFISRNRVSFSSSFMNRIMFGALTEPVVFAMDRKMCLGIKQRAERNFKRWKEKSEIQRDLSPDLLS